MKTRFILGLLALVAIVAVFTLGVDAMSLMAGGATILPIVGLAWIKDGVFNTLSVEAYEKLSKEEQIEYMEAAQKDRHEKEIELAKKITKLEEDAETNKEEIEKLTMQLNGITLKDFRELLKTVEIHAKELTRQKEEGEITRGQFRKSLKKQWDANYKNIESAIKNKGAHDFEMKATQTYGDITDGEDFAQMRPGIIDLPVRMPKIRDLFSRIPLSTEFYKYPEQETVIRDAQNVALCAAAVSTTKETIIVRDMSTKKIKDIIEFCIDFVSDYAFMESRIRKLITESLALKIDNDLLLADGLGNNPFSIDFYASEFNAANPVADISLSIQDANYIDLIGGMETQISELGLQGSYVPDTVLVNKVDWFKEVESRKDANNNYLDQRIVTVNGMPTYKGMQIIWTPIVAQNTLYVFDRRRAEILDRQSVGIEIAYENKDNWENELASLKAYERLNLWCPVNWQNAFMKCSDVATAIAAIKKP